MRLFEVERQTQTTQPLSGDFTGRLMSRCYWMQNKISSRLLEPMVGMSYSRFTQPLALILMNNVSLHQNLHMVMISNFEVKQKTTININLTLLIVFGWSMPRETLSFEVLSYHHPKDSNQTWSGLVWKLSTDRQI